MRGREAGRGEGTGGGTGGGRRFERGGGEGKEKAGRPRSRSSRQAAAYPPPASLRGRLSDWATQVPITRPPSFRRQKPTRRGAGRRWDQGAPLRLAERRGGGAGAGRGRVEERATWRQEAALRAGLHHA